MSSLKRKRTMLAVAALVAATAACAQWTFRLDTTFGAEIIQQNVNSLLVLPDGKLIASGIMRFPGEMSDKRLVRLNDNGSRDETFNNSGLGGSRIVEWENGIFYVQPGATVRRILPSGIQDPSFIGMNTGPYFNSLSGGDYHVFTDGRVLLSGSHMLSDTARGYVGQYRLIWFSNEGYLDTTRTHRQANGTIWEFKELPDGKFICTCSCSQYEGQPVSRVFRVHADGSLDTTFQSTINAGNIYEIEPLLDGKVLLGGNFRFTGAPQDTVRLARLHADGTRDTAFASLAFAGNGSWWSPSGTIVFDIFPFHGSNHIIAGQFTSVNGELRKGLCMVDEDGNLLDAFDECGVGPFTYQGSTNATPLNVYWNEDSTAIYICGAYQGYDDGTINDPTQRFVSRLLVSELTVGVEEQDTPPANSFTMHPNPTRSGTVFHYQLAPGQGVGRIELRDISGRLVSTLPMPGAEGQHYVDTSALAPGTYLVLYLADNTLLHSGKLVVQQ